MNRSLPLRLSALTLVLVATAAQHWAQDTDRAAEEQYRFLVGLVERGLHEEAVREGTRFLRGHPDSPRAPLARYRLADALWQLDRHRDAAREYEVLGALDGFEYRSESLFRVGEAARESGDEARARRAFEQVLAGDQAYLHAPARLALADIDFRAGATEDAERGYRELLRAAPDSPEASAARRGLAWCAWEKGDASETIRRARRFLGEEREPGRRDELALLLGEALLESGAADDALKVFGEVRTPASAAAALRGRGHALVALERFEEAAQAFESLLADPGAGTLADEARVQAGIARLRAGDSRKAIEHLRAASRGGDSETAYWLARAWLAEGQPARSLEVVERALEGRPEETLAGRLRVLRGDSLMALGRQDEARRAYASSGSSQAVHAAAVAALNQGDTAEAIRLAETLRGPSMAPDERELLGEAYFRAGRHGDAERALAPLLEGAPPEVRARALSRIAWCRYLSGDGQGAVQAFTQVSHDAADRPEGAEALALLARIRFEGGDLESARRLAAQALDRSLESSLAESTALLRARAEAGIEGNGARAIQCYEALLAGSPTEEVARAARLELADLESVGGDCESAARYYGELLSARPDPEQGARARYGLAWCRWEAGDPGGCAEALEPLLGDERAPAELRVAGIELALWARVRQGELERARGLWDVFARLADDARVWEAARTLLEAQRDRKALGDADALLEACRARLGRGSLASAVIVESAYQALDADDPERAGRLLAAVLRDDRIDASIAEAAYHVGTAALRAGDSEQAAALLARAGTVDNPRAADALTRLGRLLLERGDPAGARAVLARRLERAPDGEGAAQAHFLLGEAWFREERYQEAAGELETARRSAGRDPELMPRTLFRLGVALGRLERWAECERALTELARRHGDFPHLAEAELWRGRALAARGEERGARAALERVVALDGGDLAAQARLEIGRLHDRAGRADEALSEYLKVALVYAHEPSVRQALLAAGRILEQQGQVEAARGRWRELVERFERSDEAREARAALERTNPGGSRAGGG